MTKDRAFIVKLVLALAVVAGARYCFVGVRQTGSGGIGAVSFGFGEMIVELVILGFLAAVIWAVVRAVRRRRKRDGLPPEP